MSDFLSEQHLQIMRNHAQRALRDNTGNLRDLANDIVTLLQELEEVKLIAGAAVCYGSDAIIHIVGRHFSADAIEKIRTAGGVRFEVTPSGDTHVAVGKAGNRRVDQ